MSVFLPNEPQFVIELCFPYLQPLSGSVAALNQVQTVH